MPAAMTMITTATAAACGIDAVGLCAALVAGRLWLSVSMRVRDRAYGWYGREREEYQRRLASGGRDAHVRALLFAMQPSRQRKALGQRWQVTSSPANRRAGCVKTGFDLRWF
jgi:hypothetical protein